MILYCKMTKPCWPIRSTETWNKYTSTTLLSQRELALAARTHFWDIKSFEQLKKLKKNWVRPLFRHRTNHTCHQKVKSISWDSPCKSVPTVADHPVLHLVFDDFLQVVLEHQRGNPSRNLAWKNNWLSKKSVVKKFFSYCRLKDLKSSVSM